MKRSSVWKPDDSAVAEDKTTVFSEQKGPNETDISQNNASRMKAIEVHYPSNGTHKCPYCQKEVEPDAVTCPYCHQSFFSRNPLKNAIVGIIVFAVLFFVISRLVSCESDREYDKVMKKTEQEMDRLQKNNF